MYLTCILSGSPLMQMTGEMIGAYLDSSTANYSPDSWGTGMVHTQTPTLLISGPAALASRESLLEMHSQAPPQT